MSNKPKDFTRNRRKQRENKHEGSTVIVDPAADEERYREEVRRKKQEYRDWHLLVEEEMEENE